MGRCTERRQARTWSRRGAVRLTAHGAWCAAIFVGGAPGPASAQVNVEPLRDQVSSEDPFTGNVNASFSTFRGNTEGLALGGKTLAGVARRRHLAYLSATGDYAEYADEITLAKSFAHLRYNYEVTPWLWPEAFTQVEADRFRRIRLRYLAGVGPRFGVSNGPRVKLHYGVSYMFEVTRRSNEVAAADRDVMAHRLNNYAALVLVPDERIHFFTTMYYQPRFDRFADYRFLGVGAVLFTVTEILKTRIDATVRYESVTPESVKSTDFELKNSIGLYF